MTSNYVIVSVKLYLNVGNNQYIILWNFGGRIMSGRSNQKKPGLGRVKVSVKENEVPTEKNSSRASIFATKASYVSN